MSFSDTARGQAEKNRRVIASDPKDARALLGPLEGITDPYEIAMQMGERINGSGAKNPERTERHQQVVDGLSKVAKALDAAGDEYEEAFNRFQSRAASLIEKARSTRMAITTEVSATTGALKDAAAFIKALDEQKSFALLGHLIDLGRQCRDAFGPDGLSKLAESLLIESERRAPVKS